MSDSPESTPRTALAEVLPMKLHRFTPPPTFTMAFEDRYESLYELSTAINGWRSQMEQDGSACALISVQVIAPEKGSYRAMVLYSLLSPEEDEEVS